MILRLESTKPSCRFVYISRTQGPLLLNMAARASQPLLAKTRLLQRTRLTSRGLSTPRLRYQGSFTSAAGQIATFAVLAVPTLKVALGGAFWLCSVSIAFGYGYGLGQGDAGLAQMTWREAMYRKWLATKHAKSKRKKCESR